MIRQPLALALTVLTAGVAPVQAQQSGTRINFTGIITDQAAGTPVIGAVIELPALRRHALTDGNGRFVMTAIRPGKHNMVVSHLGYKTLVKEQTIAEGELLNIMLEADPVMLRGIEVQVDRLASRRQGVGISVEAIQRHELLNTAAFSAGEFVRQRMMMRVCANGRGACVQRRGQLLPPIIYIDERRAFGLDELEAYPTYDIYLVESYEGGRIIRIYTTWFMQNLARNKVLLQQLIIR
ncbi:MAG: carboxypeptidase-like regulatory domain-containing protein [Longimicrobiales bacterium]